MSTPYEFLDRDKAIDLFSFYVMLPHLRPRVPGGVLRYISDGDVRMRQNC